MRDVQAAATTPARCATRHRVYVCVCPDRLQARRAASEQRAAHRSQCAPAGGGGWSGGDGAASRRHCHAAGFLLRAVHPNRRDVFLYVASHSLLGVGACRAAHGPRPCPQWCPHALVVGDDESDVCPTCTTARTVMAAEVAVTQIFTTWSDATGPVQGPTPSCRLARRHRVRPRRIIITSSDRGTCAK